MSFEFFIASRYLKSKKKQSFISLVSLLSVLGVVVGVMALVVVIAVMSGVEESFREKLLGLEPHITLYKYGKFGNYERIIKKIKERDIKTKEMHPFIYSQVMIKSTGTTMGAILRSVDNKTNKSFIKGFTKEEILKKLPERDKKNFKSKIILGYGLANALGVKKGDSVYVVTSNNIISPIGHLPTMSRFEVSDTFKTGIYDYDNSLFYINMNDAKRILKMKGSISGIGIWIHDIYDAEKISNEINSIFPFPYSTKNWMQMNQSIFTALKLEKTAMFIILTLIVFVAAFNIASSLIMMVMEKTKDIAILKAMGATNKTIKKIFVINGLSIGLVGTFFGVVFGVFICFLLKNYQFIHLPDAYPFSTIPINLNFYDVLIIAISTILICFLAAVYPANKASKLDPVEAIRYA